MQVDTFTTRQLLAAGQLPEALEQLSQSVLSSQFRNDLILLSGQWEESERSFNNNLIEYDDHSRERSRLTVGVLGLLDRMEAGFFKESALDRQLYFFESGAVLLPKEERVYQHNFLQKNVRYIYWELRMLHAESATKLDFDFAYEIYHPDQSLMAHRIVRHSIDRGWTNSYFTNGWGWEMPGKYPLGKYSVKTYVNGQPMAEGIFIIGEK